MISKIYKHVKQGTLFYEAYRLTSRQLYKNRYFKNLHPLDQPLWLPTEFLQMTMSSTVAWRQYFGCIKQCFKPKDKESYIVTGKIIPKLMLVEKHPTIHFISQVANGCDPLETSRFLDLTAGKKSLDALLMAIR